MENYEKLNPNNSHYESIMSYQHQLDARIDDVHIHSMIGVGWECLYIRDIMGVIHSVYDVKNYIEFVETDIAQCRAPYKGDIGSNPMIGIMFYFCFCCVL